MQSQLTEVSAFIEDLADNSILRKWLLVTDEDADEGEQIGDKESAVETPSGSSRKKKKQKKKKAISKK